MSDEPGVNKPKEIRVVVDYKPGRWGQTFHIFDTADREIILERNDAKQVARKILNIILGGDKK